jgi:uncharacterized membrane protein
MGPWYKFRIPMSAIPTRRAYVDWMRGLSVLIMIEAHVIDSWTRNADAATTAYRWAKIVGGFAAPIFLFLAGVAVVMAAAGRTRRTGDRAASSWSVQRRGWEVFGLGMLFRLQSWILSPGATVKGIFKADILNIMGPTIALTAWLWGVVTKPAHRLWVYGALTCLFGFLTPIVRNSALVTYLPPPLEWYVHPVPKLSVFTIFPWSGFVFAGAFVGELLDRVQSAAAEWRLNKGFALAGVACIAAGWGATYLPSIYARSEFWTSSPTYYFLRIGIMLTLLALIYVWVQQPFAAAPPREAPRSLMLVFGRSSLFVYWIHVELAYGIFTLPLHKSMSIGWAFAGYALFTLAMYGLTLLKNWLVSRWHQQRGQRLTTATTG